MDDAFRKDSFEYEMMREFYLLIKEFWVVREEDDYWISLIDKSDAFAKKYEDSTEFALALALSFVKRCDGIHKKRIDSNNKEKRKL